MAFLIRPKPPQTHLVIPDSHAHPDFHNRRAKLAGKLIVDLKPDTVINGGDQWDFPSLSSYDKGKKSFHGASYKKDLDAGLEFDEFLWWPLRKAKKKKPRSVFCEGNHENRLKKVIEMQYQELDGIMGFNDLDLTRNYTDIVEYTGKGAGNIPGSIKIDGINYAHFFPSGPMGFPIGGVHPAASLISKGHESCTAFHLHQRDFAEHKSASGKPIIGMMAGVFQDYESTWAGKTNNLWWRGLIICRNVEDGYHDPQFISMEQLESVYGGK